MNAQVRLRDDQPIVKTLLSEPGRIRNVPYARSKRVVFQLARPARDDLFLEIGRRLAAAIRDAGREQIDLARELNVSEATVSRWISGENRIDIAQLRRAANYLDKPMWWMLGEEPPDPDSAFAHELHRLSPEDRERAIEIIRALKRTAREGG